MDLNIIWIALAAFIGTIIAGIGGFLADNETWNWRKFLTTVITGLGAALTMAIASDIPAVLTTKALFVAAVFGIGVNQGRVVVSNMISNRRGVTL